MKSSRFLCALAAATALTSTACSSTRTVYVTPQPPNACTRLCPPQSLPILARDNRERTEQEQRMIEDYGVCYALHEACVTETLRRLKE